MVGVFEGASSSHSSAVVLGSTHSEMRGASGLSATFSVSLAYVRARLVRQVARELISRSLGSEARISSISRTMREECLVNIKKRFLIVNEQIQQVTLILSGKVRNLHSVLGKLG
jgi:hypothetical protein